MVCRKCGGELIEGASFCTYCGKKIRQERKERGMKERRIINPFKYIWTEHPVLTVLTVLNIIFCASYCLYNDRNLGEYAKDLIAAIIDYNSPMVIGPLEFSGHTFLSTVILIAFNIPALIIILIVVSFIGNIVFGDDSQSRTYTTYKADLHSNSSRLDENNWIEDEEFIWYLKEKKHMTEQEFENLSRDDKYGIFYKFNGEYRSFP